MKKGTWKGAAILALVLGVGPAAGGVIDRDFHESFDVEQGDVLYLKHGDGDVDIQPWDQDVLDVTVRYHLEYRKVGLGKEPDFDVSFDRRGKGIYVTGHEQGSVVVGFFQVRKQEKYTYTICAPRYLELELEGDDGDVSIQGWRADVSCLLDDGEVKLNDVRAGKIRLRLEDGDLEARLMEGEIDLRMEDGDAWIQECKTSMCTVESQDGQIEIVEAEGNFRIDLDDGDVTLREVRAGMCEIAAEDGDVRLDLLKEDRLDLDVEVEDGDIHVALQPGFSVDFTVTTRDGRIDLDLPDAKLRTDQKHRKTGEVGSGKGKVRLQAADGSITLRQSRR